MTQIINDKLKKICENCREQCDKPCAWISLGNEYCDDIMELQKEIERLNNIIDELEKSLVNEINNKYSSNEYKQTMNLVLLKLKKLKGSDEE